MSSTGMLRSSTGPIPVNSMELAGRAALRRALAERFGCDLFDGERMAVPAIPEWT